MKAESIFLIIATMSTGMMAGIFFTWTNAVTPGIGKLTNIEYLRALQSMNRVILNPWFYFVFFAAVASIPIASGLHFSSHSTIVFWLLLTAVIIYWVGAFATTFFGNIPLNNLLDQATLSSLSEEQLLQLRNDIESKWNNFNLLRTISSVISFLLLVLICIIK